MRTGRNGKRVAARIEVLTLHLTRAVDGEYEAVLAADNEPDNVARTYHRTKARAHKDAAKAIRKLIEETKK